MDSRAYAGHCYFIINTSILQSKLYIDMNKLPLLDRIIQPTMPLWWPIATVLAFIFTLTQIL